MLKPYEIAAQALDQAISSYRGPESESDYLDTLSDLEADLEFARKRMRYAELPSDMRTWTRDEMEEYRAASFDFEEAHDSVEKYKRMWGWKYQ